MRQLKLNNRGILAPQKSRIHTGGPIHAYSQPTRALLGLDQLIKTKTPKILFSRRQGGIGDVLMTTPTVRAISKKYNCKIDYATDPDYLDGALVKVLQYSPYINNIIPWRDLDVEQYNVQVDVTCPCIAHEQPGAKPINRIDLFAQHVKITLEDHYLDYFIQDKELEWAKSHLQQNNLLSKRLILIQPASSSDARDAPFLKQKNALIDLFSKNNNYYGLIITHGSDHTKTEWNIKNTICINNFDIRQLAAIMHYCELVICPDSSILHLASALHKKTLTIFGPTDPRARVNYHPEAVAIWPAKHLRSYPIWYEKPKDGYICWKMLEEKIIADTAISMLENTTLPASRDFVTYGSYTMNEGLYEVL